MEDAALVAAAVAGDKSAFAAIYDRYADAVHDFCWSVLRDRDEAADIMQDTFLIAARQLASLREPSKLRSWLFAIARHEAIRRGKKLKRAVPTEGVGEMEFDRGAGSEVEAGAAADVDRAGIQALVWAAADGLSERDRAILDLNLRQGLEGQELADALGVSASQSYVLMSRLRDQVERSLGALLVARKGDSECPELQAVLRGWDGKFTPLMRKRVARHVDSCEICTEARKGLMSPLAAFAATPALAAPAALRDRVLGQIELVAASRPPRGWRGDGFPPGSDASRRGPLLAAVAAIVLVLALAAGVLAAGLGGGDDRVEIADGSTTTTQRTTTTTGSTSTTDSTTTTSSTSTTTTSTTAVPLAPARLVVGGNVALGDVDDDGEVTVTNSGGESLTWTATSSQPWLTVSPISGTLAGGRSQTLRVVLNRAAAPEGDVAASVTVNASAAGTGTAQVTAYVPPDPPVITNVTNPGTVGSCNSAAILADVDDESDLTVTLDYSNGADFVGSVPMTLVKGSWTATLAKFPSDKDTVYYTVRAVDEWGAKSASKEYSFEVGPC